MVRDVLIVDEDESFLTTALEKLEPFAETFTVLIATEESDARMELAKKPLSAVVVNVENTETGLGLAILDHVAVAYPEIPVVVTSKSSSGEIKKLAQKQGAVALLDKPVNFTDLGRKISSAIRKEGDAGTLRGVSPGMFLQMIEMEERSCVIRMEDEPSNSLGVLFFRQGELLDARVRDLAGPEAAYIIFSWDAVSLSIQNGCPPKEPKIFMNAQAVLLEAMRRRDEGGGKVKPKAPAAPGEEQLGGYEEDLSEGDLEAGADVSLGSYEELSDEDLEAPASPAAAAEAVVEPINTLNLVRNKLERELGDRCGLKDVVHDGVWDDFVAQADQLGALFAAGKLRICYVDSDKESDLILIPGEKTTVVTLKPRCPKNKVVDVLST